MKFDLDSLKKHAEVFQTLMSKKQEELAKMTFEASAGGGMVRATVNGKHELLNLSIDPSIITKDNADMLQDLIVAAVNEGFRQATDAIQKSLSGMMGGLGSL